VQTDLVIHAPGKGPLARGALVWLAGAIFGEDAPQLAAAIRMRGLHVSDRFSVIDAYGPNPNHPLADPRLISAMRDSIAPHAIATVTILRPHMTSARGFGGGGGFSGFGGLTSTSAQSPMRPRFARRLEALSRFGSWRASIAPRSCEYFRLPAIPRRN
jgi:hypothetical protein